MAGNIGPTETTKRRLESSFKVLQTILLYRDSTESPGLGWAIERALIDRELRELEADLRQTPAISPAGLDEFPRGAAMNPHTSPYLQPRLGRGPDRLMNSSGRQDPDEDDQWPEPRL